MNIVVGRAGATFSGGGGVYTVDSVRAWQIIFRSRFLGVHSCNVCGWVGGRW